MGSSEKNGVNSNLGIALVRKLYSEGIRIFTTKQAREFAPVVGVSEEYLGVALHHLEKKGWLIRVRRGLYAIASLETGENPVHEFEIAMFLAKPAAIAYWSALNHHGLTEQIPRKVFVLTTMQSSVPREKVKGSNTQSGYTVDKVTYQFIKVKPDRFFGVEKIWVGDARVSITDPERTLLDGLMKPRYCGDFGEVFHAFEVRKGQLDLDKIIDYALKLDVSTIKRLGWVLEKIGIERNQLTRLAKIPASDYRNLDPSAPKRGSCNRYWMIQENFLGRTVL